MGLDKAISLNDLFNAVIEKVISAKAPFVATPIDLFSQVYSELYGESLSLHISVCTDMFDLLKRSKHTGISICPVDKNVSQSQLKREYIWSWNPTLDVHRSLLNSKEVRE